MRVRKAVFPAAGWGTRFLPATKAQPKEMLPLVDKPVIQYAVEEAVAAGIEQVIIVTSSQKRAIEDHFDISYELEHLLEEKGDIEMLRRIRHITDLAQVAYVRQKEQLGLGHAVLDGQGARRPRAVRGDPVRRRRRRRAARASASSSTPTTRPTRSVVAVMEVPHEETDRYGVIAGEPVDGDLNHGRLHRSSRLVEKPTPDDAPSNLAIIGRYVLTPKIFDKLEQTQHGAGGEIQLTDAIEALMQEQAVYGYEFEGIRYDAGTTMGWLQASVELALQRPDLAPRVPDLPPAARALSLRPAVRPASPTPRHRRTVRSPRRPTVRGEAAAEGRRTEGQRGGDRDGSRRPVSADRAARPGRHGDDLPRPRQPARPRRRRQAPPTRVRPRPRASARASARRPQTAASLNHPNIVAVYDYGQDDAGPFIVMELVEGEDLASIIRRSGALPPRQAARIAPEAARALQAAHAAGDRPSRREARQHPDQPRRPGQGRRLRDRPGGRRGPDDAARARRSARSTTSARSRPAASRRRPRPTSSRSASSSSRC